LFCPQRNEIKDALDLFESALRSHRAKYGDIHHLTGAGLHNCGIVHMVAGNYVQARMCFQEAISIRTAALGYSHPDVAVSDRDTFSRIFFF
jgi:tetratricopeptide (TPR) repeat protein